MSLQLADGLVASSRTWNSPSGPETGQPAADRRWPTEDPDFGLARLLQPVTSEPTVTSTGTPEFAGTLPYMAPEQVRGEAIDARTDVYAAGAVVHTSLRRAGPLFPGARVARSLSAPSSVERLPKPKAINPQLSDSLEHVILSALSKDRTTRLFVVGRSGRRL